MSDDLWEAVERGKEILSRWVDAELADIGRVGHVAHYSENRGEMLMLAILCELRAGRSMAHNSAMMVRAEVERGNRAAGVPR